MAEGPRIAVSGLTAGTMYTALLDLWADEKSPDVKIVVGSTEGSTSSVKSAPSTVSVTFQAIASTATIALHSVNQGGGGAVWITGALLTQGRYTGSMFHGSTPASATTGQNSWEGVPNASRSISQPVNSIGASRIAVTWRPRRWLVI